MLNIRRLSQSKKGFTLIELLLAMAISSLIALSLFSILNISNKSCNLIEDKDELMLNANFAIDYLKNEIKSADMIISSHKFSELDNKRPTNIGFVIMTNGDSKGEYRYITYYTQENDLIRIACKKESEDYPSADEFKGFNKVCEFVENINHSKFNGENSIINLDFKFKSKSSLNLKSDIYIRCEIDY